MTASRNIPQYPSMAPCARAVYLESAEADSTLWRVGFAAMYDGASALGLEEGVMTAFDLRPLNLGEILDRTFTLYRQHFLLFIGISAIPQTLVLAINVVSLLLGNKAAMRAFTGLGLGLGLVIGLVVVIVSVFAFFISQGATILAVKDLYLGRSTSILDSLRRTRGEIWPIIGVGLLTGLVVTFGLVLLVFPGIFIACRLFVSVPAMLTESRGVLDAMSRSWDLTQGAAGRSFVIFLLYLVIVFALAILLVSPFTALAVFSGVKSPEMMRFWTFMADLGNRVSSTLVSPFLLIASAVFYFDLRVRKEAFDLQFMMDPESERTTGPSSSGMPSILS